MNDSDTELELYEEVVGSLDYPTPNNGRSTSPVTSAYGPSLQAPSYGPIVENRRVENGDFPSSVCSELAPQPALRQELAGRDSSAAVVTDRDGFATILLILDYHLFNYLQFAPNIVQIGQRPPPCIWPGAPVGVKPSDLRNETTLGGEKLQ